MKNSYLDLKEPASCSKNFHHKPMNTSQRKLFGASCLIVWVCNGVQAINVRGTRERNMKVYSVVGICLSMDDIQRELE